MQIAGLLRRNPDVVRVPIDPREVGGVHEFINAEGDLRRLPSHMADPDPRFSGIDGFFAAQLRRQG